MPPTRENLDIVTNEVRTLLDSDPSISPALRALIKLMLGFIEALCAQKGLSSRNSSKPPAADPNRKKSTRQPSGRKPGGQPGHVGSTLELVDEPDTVCPLPIDRRTLPKGRSFTSLPPERRQVFDIEVHRVVTEYQAEVLIDELGNRYTATFPDTARARVQYGAAIKAHAIYLSQYQLLPYDRIREYFGDQFGLPLSAGSLVNFNREIYNKLTPWEHTMRQHLLNSTVLHADETGINVNGKRVWLHVCSNTHFTYLMHHIKRGGDAMQAMGILPNYDGVLCHDHWKAYYSIAPQVMHSLCNAHHQRELTWSFEEDKMVWAGQMHDFLQSLNTEVTQAGGVLVDSRQRAVRKAYRKILTNGEADCPAPQASERKPKQRGRIKRSKSRNLLERLQTFEDDTLRFMTHPDIPYTNNQGEQDLRMSKVQQKISGCFRSEQGAQMFCRIRGYVSTCRKQGMSATDAIKMALTGKLPSL
jgi:transposase